MGAWSLAQDAEGRPLPLNRDAWDGYPAARDRVFAAVVESDRDLVVLTGDVHSSWAQDLATDFTAYNVVTHTGSVGVEAVAPGITSGGGVVELADNLAAATPHIKWANSALRGFVVMRASHDELTAEWHLLPEGAIESETFVGPTVEGTFAVRPGEPWWTD
jgi:alkaline phosphatase D